MAASIHDRPMNASPQPIVVPCRGVSPTGRLVERVTREVERMGVAVASSEADSVPENAVVVALDGCASGCSARMLEASGIEPALTLDLRSGRPGDAKRIARGIVERLGDRRRSPVRRSRTGFNAAPAAMSRRQHTADDYLLAIDRLGSAAVECGAVPSAAPTVAAHVSRLLGVTAVSVAQMVSQLEREGLISRSRGKSLVLTNRGRARADAAIRRQRILECFATRFLGHALPEAFERAFQIGTSFDSDALERTYEALGRPDRCPHGWPVDAEAARAESPRLVALPALAEGGQATVVRIDEDNRDAATELANSGLELGAVIREARRDGDDLLLKVEGMRPPARLSVACAKAVFALPGA